MKKLFVLIKCFYIIKSPEFELIIGQTVLLHCVSDTKQHKIQSKDKVQE